MSIIVPTITTDDQQVFATNVAKFAEFSNRIHIDVSDGTLAPTNLLPLESMTLIEGREFDIHLMSVQPSAHLQTILALKPSLCILHAEANDDVLGLFNQLKQAEIKAGLALIKGTFPGKYRALIEQADHVLIFAGELGSQGGQINMLQREKIPLVKDINSAVEIAWDGGINLSNVRAVANSQVDVMNVGSAITSAEDPAAMYQSLIAESEKRGVLL